MKDIKYIEKTINEARLTSRLRSNLEVNIYRNIDAIINRQIEVQHKVPENKGGRRYLHTFCPDITINIGGEEIKILLVTRLDTEEVYTSNNGRKTVYKTSHYRIKGSNGENITIGRMTNESMEAFDNELDKYYDSLRAPAIFSISSLSNSAK